MDPLLVVGSVALDTVETPSGRRDDLLGGSATHFSVSARHFAPVQLVGVVGRDFPQGHIDLLGSLGVCTLGLERADGRTFRWHGRYNGSLTSRETISVELNVLADFKPKIPDGYRGSRFVLLGNGHPVTQAAVLDQLRSPEFVMMDTMDLWIETQREALRALLPRVHALCVNHEEAMLLADTGSVARAIRTLTDWGVRALVIKKAEHGAVIATREFMFAVPSFPTEQVIDPTGAGDSFAGGLLGALARDGTGSRALRRALVYGSVMGSLSVESFGIERLVSAGREEIEDRFRRLIGMITL